MLEVHYEISCHHILATDFISSSLSVWAFLFCVKCGAKTWEHKEALPIHVLDESPMQLVGKGIYVTCITVSTQTYIKS